MGSGGFEPPACRLGGLTSISILSTLVPCFHSLSVFRGGGFRSAENPFGIIEHILGTFLVQG